MLQTATRDSLIIIDELGRGKYCSLWYVSMYFFSYVDCNSDHSRSRVTIVLYSQKYILLLFLFFLYPLTLN